MSDKISSRWPVQHYPSPIYGHTAVAVELPTTAFINFTGSPDLQSRKVMLLNGGWPWNSSSQPNVSLVLDTNTWTWWNVYVPLEFPKNRHYHTFVSSSTGDFAIMFGGYQSMKYLNDLYILSTNPTTFGWYRIETPCCAPKGRYGHASVLVESDDSKFKLFLFGGVTEGNVPLADMYVLEFTPLETSPPNWNFTWTQVNFTGASPEPRFFHSLNHQNSDILYLFGGTKDGVYPVNDRAIFKFDLSDYSWSSSPFTSQIPSSVGIWGHGSVVYNDFILYFGGYPAEWGSSALQYFIANDTFTSIDTIPTNTWPYPSAKRSFSTCTFKNGLNNEHVIVFGGISDTPSQEMNVLLLEEKRFSWASTNISSVVLMSQTDEFSTLKLNGWGFVDSESRSGLYNYVVLETLGDSSECILKHASFSEIVCVTSKFYPESTISLKIMRYADDYLESQGSFVLKTEDGKDQPASSTFIQSTIPGYSTRPPSTVITSVIRETATVIVDAGSLPGISGVANVPLSILVPAILGIVFVSFICGVSAVFCVRHFRSKGLYRKKMNSEEKYESMDTVCNNA